MDNIVLLILAAVLLVTWLLIPICIAEYRRHVVPRRYDEIRDHFMKGVPLDEKRVKDERGETAAWHYSRLQNPGAAIKDEEAELKATFEYYHARKRYSIPYWLILILSALSLVFVGLWAATRLAKGPLTVEASAAGTNAVAVVGAGTTNAAPGTNAPGQTAGPARNPTQSTGGGLIARVDTSIVMALLGAVVWSLYEVFSRRRTGDLTPIELYDIVNRFVVAVPIGYGFSLLVFDNVSPWLAFVASAFPLRDIRQLMRKNALRKLGETPASSSSLTAQSYIGQMLTDIGEQTIVRLEELNIVTCMDLAYTDPVRLAVKTGAPIKLVLAWIDKALLAVYAAPHLREFEKLGMPCAMDACGFYVQHCWDLEKNKERADWATNKTVVALADRLKIMPECLVLQMLRSVYSDPHTQFLIRAWFGPATKQDGM